MIDVPLEAIRREIAKHEHSIMVSQIAIYKLTKLAKQIYIYKTSKVWKGNYFGEFKAL